MSSKLPTRIVFIAFGVVAHGLQVVWVCDEVGKTGEVIIASVLRIEVVRRLADVLAAGGFDQPVDGVVGVVADRLDLLAVVEDRLQRGVFDAGDVSRRVVGVAQVLHDCRIGEEL